MGWIVFCVILFMVVSAVWRAGSSALRALFTPIINWAYKSVLNMLMDSGVEETAARAIISAAIIFIIVIAFMIIF